MYKLGDMCTGGSFFLSRKAYESFHLYHHENLRFSFLYEDHLFAIHCVAGGNLLADFSRKDDIMAINYRDLPMSVEDLLNHKKKIVHPIKDPNDPAMETNIRNFFSKHRLTLQI